MEQYLKKHVRPDASIEDLQPFLHAFRIQVNACLDRTAHRYRLAILQSVLAHAYPELEQWIGIDSKSTNPAHDFPARLQAMATSYSTLVISYLSFLSPSRPFITLIQLQGGGFHRKTGRARNVNPRAYIGQSEQGTTGYRLPIPSHPFIIGSRLRSGWGLQSCSL